MSQSNFSCLSHLQRNLSTEEKKMRRQLIVAFEKQTLKLQWKEDKIIRGKANSYFRRLSGRFRKNEEISKVVSFFLLWVEAQNEIGRNKLHMVQRKIRDRKKNFLFC